MDCCCFWIGLIRRIGLISHMSGKWKFLLTFGLLTTLVVWLTVFSISSSKFKIVACDVGQGDASLVVYKDFEILIDGGPGNRVLDCLSDHMPFWDRTLEIVILTHPQADHYTGLISVFERYKVEKFLANSLDAGSQTYSLLKNQVLDGGTEVVNATTGTGIRSGMIYLDIVHPSENFLAENLTYSNTDSMQNESETGVLGASDSTLDPNEFSITALLSFGSFNFLFTGDAGTEILDNLALTLQEKGINSVNYIKVPHHGSRYSISEKMYEILRGGVATISVGKNSYGHPHGETLKILDEKEIKTFRTDKDGDIVVITDGKRMWIGEK